MIWFTSDEHYFHKNLLELTKRPFDNIDNMNKALINNFNNIVKDCDTVYHVGDFCFGNSKQVKEILRQLNGKHVLISGNHDKNTVSTYYKAGFVAVLKEVKIRFGKETIVISHYPYKDSLFKYLWLKYIKKFRFSDRHKRPNNEGLWLIHGHTHKKAKLKDKQINICVDAWNYLPVSFRQIESIIQSNQE